MGRALKALTVLLVVWLVSPVVPATGSGSSAPEVHPIFVADLSPTVAGRPTELTAIVVQDDHPMADTPATLMVRRSGSDSFVPVGQDTSDANGFVAVSTVLDRNATARWELSDDSSVVSEAFLVEVSPAVTRRANDRTLRRGQRFVVRGRTFPAKAGCRVQLWRGELRPLVLGPRPVRLARSTVRADGTYRLTRRFHKPRRMHVAVVVKPCADNGRGLSRYLRIRVR